GRGGGGGRAGTSRVAAARGQGESGGQRERTGGHAAALQGPEGHGEASSKRYPSKGWVLCSLERIEAQSAIGCLTMRQRIGVGGDTGPRLSMCQYGATGDPRNPSKAPTRGSWRNRAGSSKVCPWSFPSQPLLGSLC